MSKDVRPHKSYRWSFLAKAAPGVVKILSYQKSELPHNLVPGLSVAAVTLPVGVAYAQLEGFNPAVGLYSSILPLVVRVQVTDC